MEGATPGSANVGRSYLPCTRAGIALPVLTGHLSTAADAHLRVGDRLVVPWDVALALGDADAGAERLGHAIGATLPAWLNDDDRFTLLGPLRDVLPPRAPMVLEVDHHGVYGYPSSEFFIRWMDADGFTLEPEPEDDTPGTVRWKGLPHRLSISQHRVLEHLERIPAMGTSRERDLSAIDEVRSGRVEGDDSVSLGSGLRGEHIRSVDAVRPFFARASRTQEVYRLMPTVEGIPDRELWGHLRGQPSDRIGSGFSYRDEDGTRVRVAFTERAREALRRGRAASARLISSRAVAQIVTEPERYLPEEFDLSGLSERVTGIGPVVMEARRERSEVAVGGWFAWEPDLALEGADGEDGGRLDLRDPEVVGALEAAIRQADADGAGFIPNPRGSGLIAVTQPLREAVAMARERLDAGDQEKESEPKEGLLVKGNLEELDYDTASDEAPEAVVVIAQPAGLVRDKALLAHQLIGLAWLRKLSEAAVDGPSQGAILADDMGLGKTLQVLGLWSDLLEQGRAGPHLVVAPVALLENWAREAWTFFQERLQPVEVFDSSSSTGLPPDRVASRLQRQFLVLVSYETLRRHEFAFARVKWETVILDEAQKAKNAGTQIARVVRTLDTRLRLAVTGTPVENSLVDLWTLYDWAVPGLFGSLRDFKRDYVHPIAGGASHEARATLAADLAARIEPVFMRRLKAQVLDDLPSLHRHDHEVALSAGQERAYGAVIASIRNGTQHPLGALPRLFGVCAHPELSWDRDALAAPDILPFPKLAALWSILDPVHEAGEKALVFAGRKAIQRWLADAIGDRYRIRRPRVINGQISGSIERLRVIDEFSARPGFDVLVLAPRAAGVGLNITAANHVVHYMREWNPAVENQATDRCYRIGQTKPVHVHTITCTSSRGETVERRLAVLLEEKRRLINEFAIPMGGFELDQAELAAAEWRVGESGFDPDLFEPDLVQLLQRLSEHPGVRVEPPEEHLDGGRVVGMDAAVVEYGGRRIHLVDDGPNAAALCRAIERSGGFAVTRNLRGNANVEGLIAAIR